MVPDTEQHVGGTMHIAIIPNRIDALELGWDPGVHVRHKGDPVRDSPAFLRMGVGVPDGRAEGPTDVAVAAPAVGSPLRGALGWRRRPIGLVR
jgi:hypothetical protein